MAFITIDHPDEVITWFATYPGSERDRRAGGPCPHAECRHLQTECIGWGPDAAHYELVICTDGCGGDCRGWFPAPGTHAQHVAIRWQHLAPPPAGG